MNFCLWITGLPGSGKSTILKELTPMPAAAGIHPVVLSLDRLRPIITPDPAYSDQERDIVYRTLAVMAQLLVAEGRRHVIIDATANRRAYRDLARRLIADFAEIHIHCPVAACQAREAARQGRPVEKDLYQRAAAGTLAGRMPGVTAVYEAPEAPELRLPSDRLSPRQAAERIMAYLGSRWPAHCLRRQQSSR
jgi:adenylylsulfate kinase